MIDFSSQQDDCGVELNGEQCAVRTVAEDPAIASRMQDLTYRVWPRFITEGHLPAGHSLPADWGAIFRCWPYLQFALLHPASDELIACGNAVALAWDANPETLSDAGWNWAMFQAKVEYVLGVVPVTLCAVSITVAPEYQGQGASRLAIQAMRRLARAAGLRRMIAPVRPTRKAEYPNVPMAEYMRWENEEGLPYDPWLRTHVRLGASIVKPCNRSMLAAGTIAEWEAWGGGPFLTFYLLFTSTLTETSASTWNRTCGWNILRCRMIPIQISFPCHKLPHLGLIEKGQTPDEPKWSTSELRWWKMGPFVGEQSS